ncbi:type III pantothenate kinase [Marinovum sp. 2_MG-2023]|uniref:type III pantothenate kinase n=1 Tax=Roseobacteraceae TaxID=2854170 RepID=UPI001FD1657C|nr:MULTISPECIES: type III pantothenate kinase [Roseobacteraceae]MCJ7872428.1 type III pantothenate kinase [Phaeobacter sp. J2-8]MDO6729299.1 type III pantothenate kinase [Marinovum sp. 2_MG-2023]MDO6780486.1 type III pantothenate kinase [Marinovum sp. 1_MG-2023]
MLLCIDCGNTNTVFSIWDGTEFLCTLRTSTHHARTADAYFTWYSTLVTHYGIKAEITEVIISTTVPRVLFNLRVFTDRFFNCRPLVVGKPECLLPHDARVDAGTAVGPDRLVNTAGAFDRHGGDLIVVDFGTATTFDVVAHDGAYVGGVIAPGVNLSLEALHMGAAALPHVDISQPEKVIGTNTVNCIQSGVFWGYVGLVNGICDRIRGEYARPMRIIGTGGLAPLFAQGQMLFDTIEDDLTMHGLTVIHAYNKENGNIHEQ